MDAREWAIAAVADPSRLADFRHFADTVARECGLSDADRFEIVSAVHEAAANALRHGSSSARDLIRVRAEVRADALIFFVSDQGTFAREISFLDMIGEGDFQARYGTRIMEGMAERVYITPSAHGTTVRASKRLGA